MANGPHGTRRRCETTGGASQEGEGVQPLEISLSGLHRKMTVRFNRNGRPAPAGVWSPGQKATTTLPTSSSMLQLNAQLMKSPRLDMERSETG